jgi:hypothetical protein
LKDAAQCGETLCIGFHSFAFIAILEQMTCPLVFQIVPINKSAADPFENQIKRLFSLLQ